MIEKRNLELSAAYPARFVSMDELVNHAHSAGFRLKMCHQAFYNGGVNFVHLEVPD